MSDTAELDHLILANLLDLDSAAKRIDQIGDVVWRQITGAMENWAAHTGWNGAFDESDPWVASPEWYFEGKPEAYLYPDSGPGDAGEGVGQAPQFWLSRYLGVAGGQLCLWFGQSSVGSRKWKPIAGAYAEALSKEGFHLSDAGNFYTLCTLDALHIASALADDHWDDALLPIRQALDRAAKAKPLFDELLSKARQA